LAADSVGEVLAKECAAVSALINSYVGDREHHDKARSAIMRVAEDVIDRAAMLDLSVADQKAVRDQARSLVRALIYGKSVN
jgi:hypothetical protein